MEEHARLPYRLNCEGYFVDDNGNILAQDSGKGFLIFPGGGIEQGEDIEAGMVREAREETGVIPELPLRKLGIIRIKWGNDWAKTDKQKERYAQFQGDEMHFFFAKIKGFGQSGEVDDAWKGEKLMSVDSAINLIEQARPFGEDIKEYREAQLKFLNIIKRDIKQ